VKVDHTPGLGEPRQRRWSRHETRGLLYVNVVMLLLFREYHIIIAYDKMMDISRIKKMAREMNIDMVGKGIPYQGILGSTQGLFTELKEQEASLFGLLR